VGINVKNCPNELRHYLFEINEILEGRGEKIVEQTRELIEGAEIDPRDLVKVVGVLQKPLNDNRERGKSLEGKTYRDIEIESKFNGDAKQGDIAFNQMAWDFNHDYFDFFPELAKKKRQRAIDDYLEGEREEEEKENREAIKKRKITDEARKVEQQVQEQTEVEVNSEKLVQEQAETEEKDKQHNSSEKTKNNLKNNLNQAQSSDATVEDQVQVIKDLGKIHGEEDFEEQQKQIEVIMDELGRTNPPKLVEGLVGAIEENLRKNDLTIAELPTEIQEDYQDYQNIKDNQDNQDNQDKVDKINETIGKTGAQKRFKKLKTELSKVAKFTQAQAKKMKEKLLRFICSKNKYEQAYQAEVRQLLKQLENYEQKQLNSENESSTVGVGRMASIIGGGLLAVGLIIGT
jgi:hypothetical protein